MLLAPLVAGAQIAGHALALTGGPGEPLARQFEPVGMSNLVDPATGDLTYRIELGDIGGYPLVLAYDSTVTMDDEASWVGLGWGLSPGAISRSKRGVFDDANGDVITEETDLRPNTTVGVVLSPDLELFGFSTLGNVLDVGVGGYHNNYNGFGIQANANMKFAAGDQAKGALTGGLGINVDSNNGLTLTPRLGLVREIDKNRDRFDEVAGLSLGVPINSREGLEQLSLGGSVGWKREVGEAGKKRIVSENTTWASGVSFLGPDSLPRIQLPMFTAATRLELGTGVEFTGAFPEGHASGYWTSQWLTRNERELPAYGYLHLASAEPGEDVLLDLQRENDEGFTKSTPNLPLTWLTYDLFSLSGQGIGGQFRAHQGSVGIVFDPVVKTTGVSATIGGEIGGGNLVRGGADFDGGYTRSTSRPWQDEDTNLLQDVLSFVGWPATTPQSTDASKALYEPVWFQVVGEATPDGQGSGWAALHGGDAAIAPQLSGSKGTPVVGACLGDVDCLSESVVNARTARQPRNLRIAGLTAAQAQEVGLHREIPYFQPGDFDFGHSGYAPMGTIRRYDSATARDQPHHLSEFHVTDGQGVRYVYGFPVLNYTEEDVVFAVDRSRADCDAGLVAYDEGEDEVGGNSHGRDHYVKRTVTPAYATDWMLTAVISADYQDKTGDGPSPDDLGSYTLFNYSLTHGDDSPEGRYRWRVPVSRDDECEANLNEGLRSDLQDDKGTYLYGEREQVVLHSIETRTHVAEFHVSPRLDGLGVAGRCGTVDYDLHQYKLDRIDVFARRDRLQRGADAIPLKSVHFAYDYSLTRGIPNTNGTGADSGKLTLRKVWFTYGGDPQGAANAYEFTYGDADHDGVEDLDLNPAYDLKAYDRWGDYKPNEGCSTEGPTTPWEDPYTDELVDREEADRRASAWLLSSVKLPSKGELRFSYEADDYAFVQDHEATWMAPIIAAHDAPDADVSADAVDQVMTSTGKVYDYLYFPLQEPLDSDQVKDLYWPAGDEVAFRFDMHLNDIDLPSEASAWDHVPGWIEIEDMGVGKQDSDGLYRTGWLKVKRAPIGDREGSKEVSPIARASWEFVKLHNPRLAYGVNDVLLDDINAQVANELYKAGQQVLSFFEGFNHHLMRKGHGIEFRPQRSWVRLRDPDGRKRGGGVRVKRVEVYDAWGELAGGNAASRRYATDYTYTVDVDGQTASSGVAASEPLAGKDESPWREPVWFEDEPLIAWLSDQQKLLAPDDRFYQEGPYGLFAHPAPSVVYSKVTSRQVHLPLDSDEPVEMTRRGTGRVVHEFYTARDFPTEVRRTSMQLKKTEPNPVFQILKVNLRYLYNPWQGWAVDRANAHGTPKAVWVYAEGKDEAPISGTEYRYRTRVDAVPLPLLPEEQWPVVTRLDNTVPVVMRDGTHAELEVGVTRDLVVDLREEETEIYEFGVQGNLDTFLAAIFPVAIPVAIPAFSKETTRMRMATATKLIDRFPVLDQIVAHDAGASVATANLAWDGVTGEVLVTETADEFDNPVFGVTWPAHWAYSGMGPAFQNEGLALFQVDFVGGEAQVDPAILELFEPGDELLVTIGGVTDRAWVLGADNSVLEVIDEDGVGVDGSGSLQVIRSGHRNQQSLPVAVATMMESPLASDLSFSIDATSAVIDANAVEYTELWGAECGEEAPVSCETEVGFDHTVPGDFPTIQQAIDAAQDGERICVDWGVYADLLDFGGKEVEVVGIAGPASTVLDGQGTGPVVTFDQGEGPGAMLRGFTVTGGKASQGAGILVSGAAPTLVDLVIGYNVASGDGGGLYAVASAPRLEHVAFTCNRASGDGGGMRALRTSSTLEDVVFWSNEAGQGGGLSVDDGSFSFVGNTGHTRLGNVAFIDNQAIGVGGGARLSAGRYELENSLFLGNVAGLDGGSSGGGLWLNPSPAVGESGISMRNLTWVDNVAQSDGVALFVAASPYGVVPVEIHSNLIAFHGGGPAGGGLAAVWQDASTNVAVDVQYTGVWSNAVHFGGMPNPLGSNGNAEFDPGFVSHASSLDPAEWDVSLSAGSLAIDAGDPSPSRLDADGTPNDMGAFGGPGLDLALYAGYEAECPSGEPVEPTDTGTGCARAGSSANPYLYGLRGAWREWRPYVYDVRRLYANPDDGGYTQGDMKRDGRYDDFEPFWQVQGSTWQPVYDLNGTLGRWRAATEVTGMSDEGLPREEVDALGRYSAAQFTWDDTLPMGVAANTRYRQLGVDDFEQYFLVNKKLLKHCRRLHFAWEDHADHVSSEAAHTGWWSLAVDSGEALAAEYDVTAAECEDGDGVPTVVDPCACEARFTPDVGERYVLGYWVYQPDEEATSPYSVRLELEVDGSPLDPTFVESALHTEAVEAGWQRVEVVFTLPASTTDTLALVATNDGQGTGFIDDVRIHPYDGRLKTFVHDGLRRSLVAELDENNYATLYEYARDGTLIRTKKETAVGIMTLQESRSHVASGQ